MSAGYPPPHHVNIDTQEGLSAVPKSPTLPDDQTLNRWPTATPPPPEMSWNSDSGGRFSNSDESATEEIEEIVDLTLPTPSPKKKKLITKFFKPTKRLPQSSGRPSNFLQQYNPRPVPASGLATGHSSTLPSSSTGPTTEVSTDEKKKGAGTRSAVNKTYTLLRKLEVLNYVANSSETIQASKREELFEEKVQEQEWSWLSDYLWRRLGHVTLSVGAGNA